MNRLTERGLQFQLPPHGFYRSESAIGRDLAILAASLYRKRKINEMGDLSHDYRCLDAFAASGMRGARYVAQAGASEVHCNDYDPRNLSYMRGNLLSAAELPLDTEIETVTIPGLKRPSYRCTDPDQKVHLSYSCIDASRLLQALALNEDYFDLVDVDSFGTDGLALLSTAIECVKYKGAGGLLYLTSTDGFCSAGHRNQRSLSAFGAFVRSTPFPNELGLRILIGAAVQVGARLGIKLMPVFSLYSYHGPVFRVMLRVTKSANWASKQYGFLAYCHACGQMSRVDWSDLGGSLCNSCGKNHLSLSGPMWTGPLHNGGDLEAMKEEAKVKGWLTEEPGLTKIITKKSNATATLGPLLDILIQEADERLQVAHYTVASIAPHLSSTPSRDRLITAMRARGHATCLSHLEPRAVRTSAKMSEIIHACTEDLGLEVRPSSPFHRLNGQDSIS